MKKNVLMIIGTRPEAIKMAPVYHGLRHHPHLHVETLCSGQHGELIDQVFDTFNWQPDERLTLSRETNEVTELYRLLFAALDEAISRRQPDMILVHGDTATTAIASLVGFLKKIPIGHVEAGLRSDDMQAPWPEEANRRITDCLADVYFAPTAGARANLLKENIKAENIHVTGNTVVDALEFITQRITQDEALKTTLENSFHYLDAARPTIFVTGHRRENFGVKLNQVFKAIRQIVEASDCQVVFPMHPNQKIQKKMDISLLEHPRIHLCAPMDYVHCAYLMQRCDLIISDSGGIQEEAPSFNKKVLVTRGVTERPEGIESGHLELVDCDTQRIVSRATAALSDTQNALPRANPYGDGKAAQRICKIIFAMLCAEEIPSQLTPAQEFEVA